ncbi:MAG: RuvX/YqgF family protein, partial [Solobacterium sp.]|nr:RuvX/YqgF family protein [Solobacterium sp.]
MKYVSLDLGSVTCGIAKSDTGFLATPVKTIRFRREDYDDAIDRILEYVEKEKPDIIVMGYPLLENDDEGPRA